jgi:CubicO group peptidase (beta-lactamase class C family)
MSRWRLVVVLVLASVALYVTAAPATGQQSSGPSVPAVPRFPLGRSDHATPPWDKLHPACGRSEVNAIRPCLQSFVDHGSVLGLVTLVDRADSIVHMEGVGQFRENSIFQIMSMTKPFVSVLVMKLVEERKLPSVDARVVEIPGFADFPHRDVTILQLLTHTSGVWYAVREGTTTGIAPHLTNKLDKQPEVTTRDKTLDLIARHYANADLYPRGLTNYQYSNIGFTLLGWIVERVSGQPFDAFMKATLLDPLGLEDTFFFPESATDAQRRRIARLDRRLPDPPDYSHYDENRPGWRYASPEGGLYSTASDLRQFMRLFRHRGQLPGGPRILTGASIDALTKDQVPEVDAGCEGRRGRSLGFFVARAPGCPDWPGFSPGTVWHNGRFSTEFWYDPQKDVIGVFLYQTVIDGSATPSLAESDAFKQMLARIF